MSLFVACLMSIDAIAILASLSLAYVVRISGGFLSYYGVYDPATYRVFLVVCVPIWLLIFALSGLYRTERLLGGLEEYLSVVRGCSGGVVSIIVISFFWRDSLELSRGWLILSWAFSVTFVGGGRLLARRLAYLLRRRGFLTAQVLIVGANDQGLAMAEQWLGSPMSGMQVIGFLDDFKPVGTSVIDGLQVLGRPTALDAMAKQTGADEVVVVSSAVAWESFEEILTRPPERTSYVVRLSPGFYATLGTAVMVSNKSFVPLLTVSGTRLVGFDVALKWIVDYSLALIVGLVALPAMGVINWRLHRVEPAIRLYQRHPVYGMGRRSFTMLKYRSRPDGPKIECWLNHTGFDKLPQLFNVLAGQMSIVGPRPRLVAGHERDQDGLHNVHTVKPGIIGPWTISTHWISGDETQDEIYYVRNWTVWLDLQVIFQTFWRWLRSGRREVRRTPQTD
jgi:lipopolysaccharide/colanic/teichoic acid biosynthesis glycosyltransferase